MNRLLLPLFLLLNVVAPGIGLAQYAQSFRVVQKEIDQMYGATYHIIQDSYGLIWVATTAGLVRYDGYEIRDYQHDRLDSTSLPGNTLYRLLEDRDSRIWISVANHGVCFYDRDMDVFHRIPVGDGPTDLKSPFIFNILEDRQGTVWIAGNNGVQYVDSVSRDPVEITFGNTLQLNDGRNWVLPPVYARALTEDTQGNLWIGNDEGVIRISPARDSVTTSEEFAEFPAISCNSIVEDRAGKLWFGVFEPPCLYVYDPATRKTDIPLPGMDLRNHSRSVLDKEGNLWITWLGETIMRVNWPDQDIEMYSTARANPFGSSGQFLRQPMVDMAGNLWMSGGSFFQIMPYTGKRVKNLSFPFESGNNVSAIFKRDSLLLVGQLFGGLNLVNMESETSTRLLSDSPGKLNLLSDRVYSIREMADGNFLVTTSTGAQIIDLKRNTSRTILDNENLVRWNHVDRDDVLWLCLERTGLLRYPPPYTSGSWVLREGEDRLRLPRQIIEDSTGAFWIASGNEGMVYYNPATGKIRMFRPIENDSNSISGYKAECIHMGSDGYIWIGTRTGLNRFDPSDSTFLHISKKEGLPATTISSILEDQTGKLWVSTSMGLIRLDPGTFESRTFTKDDGLINDNYYPRAAFKDREGNLYFGGINGVDVFKPEDMGINPVAPKMVLTELLVANQPYPVDGALENLRSLDLTYSDGFFEFTVAALHFTMPSKVEYAYKMDGFHEDWIHNGKKRTATFTGLFPGHYTFRAKAHNGDGVWSDDLTIDVYIKPPFYLTWWFFLLCGLILASAIFGIYRYRIHAIRKEERLKSEFHKKLAQVEMQALRAQMNPHFLFNSLNSVKSFIGQNRQQEAQEYLTAFAKLVRQVLNNSRKNTVRLNDDLSALRLYLKLENMRMSDGFDYEILIGDNVNPDFVEVPPLLLQPFVENAIKHGIRHKEQGRGRIQISIKRVNEHLHFTVEDNGIGRERAAMLQSLGGGGHDSMGIQLTEERMQFLRDQYGEATSFWITDLKDENGNASGTKVEILLPVAS